MTSNNRAIEACIILIWSSFNTIPGVSCHIHNQISSAIWGLQSDNFFDLRGWLELSKEQTWCWELCAWIVFQELLSHASQAFCFCFLFTGEQQALFLQLCSIFQPLFFSLCFFFLSLFGFLLCNPCSLLLLQDIIIIMMIPSMMYGSMSNTCRC